eukprot:2868657-Pyramimonas_sp.AAC.1
MAFSRVFFSVFQARCMRHCDLLLCTRRPDHDVLHNVIVFRVGSLTGACVVIGCACGGAIMMLCTVRFFVARLPPPIKILSGSR